MDRHDCFPAGDGVRAKAYQPQTGFVATRPLCLRIRVSFCVGRKDRTDLKVPFKNSSSATLVGHGARPWVGLPAGI